MQEQLPEMTTATSTPDIPYRVRRDGRWVWRCSDVSIVAGCPSVLALAEVLFAVGFYWWLAHRSGWPWMVFVGMVAAPFLLLRSPESIELGVAMLDRYWNRKWGYFSKGGKWLVIAISALTSGLVCYWLAAPWLPAHVGWMNNILPHPEGPLAMGTVALSGAVALAVALAVAVAVAGAVAGRLAIPLSLSGTGAIAGRLAISLLGAGAIKGAIKGAIAGAGAGAVAGVVAVAGMGAISVSGAISVLVLGTIAITSAVAVAGAVLGAIAIAGEVAGAGRGRSRGAIAVAGVVARVSRGTMAGASAISVLMMASFCLGILLRGMLIRWVATLRHLPSGLHRLPHNWRETLWCTDLFHPPELLPDAGRVDTLLSVKGLWKESWGHALTRTGFSTVILFWYIPALTYRWSLKASAWLWWPLALAMTAPLDGLGGNTVRERTAVNVGGSWGWLMLLAPSIALAWLLSSVPFIAAVLHLLPAGAGEIAQRLPAPPQPASVRTVAMGVFCTLGLAYWWCIRNMKATHGKVLESPKEFNDLKEDDRARFMELAHPIEKLRVLMIVAVLFFGEAWAAVLFHNVNPQVVENLIPRWLLDIL